MDARHLLLRMAENNLWANARLHGAVAHLSAADFEATRTSFFPSLRKTLEHIYVVDLYYLDALHRGGRGRAMYDVPWATFERFEQLAEAQRSADRELVAFVAAIPSDDALDERVLVSRPKTDSHERIGDLLAHVMQHQVHHRGQAHAMLSGTAVAPPQLDEFFLDEDGPHRGDELSRLGLSAR